MSVSISLVDAVKKGDLASVTRVIQSANLNQIGSALTIAAFHGHFEIAKLCLEKGASVESKNSTGNTALLLAVGSGHTDLVLLLIENGASVSVRNNNGKSAKDLAKKPEIIEIINRVRLT